VGHSIIGVGFRSFWPHYLALGPNTKVQSFHSSCFGNQANIRVFKGLDCLSSVCGSKVMV